MARGDRVVVEPVAAEFFEARVLEIKDAVARVQVLPKKDMKLVATSDLYRVGTPAPDAVKGAFGICHVGESKWVGCRVESVSGDHVEISTPSDQKHTIAATDLLAPTSVTELNLRRSFEKMSNRTAFEAELRKHRGPRAPKDYTPDAKSSVLVRIEGGWYAAKVFEIDREDLRVTWSTNGRVSDVERSDVVPMPPYPATFRHGDFVLVRPLEPAAAWQPGQIESVESDRAAVRDASGAERKVTTGDSRAPVLSLTPAARASAWRSRRRSPRSLP